MVSKTTKLLITINLVVLLNIAAGDLLAKREFLMEGDARPKSSTCGTALTSLAKSFPFKILELSVKLKILSTQFDEI